MPVLKKVTLPHPDYPFDPEIKFHIYEQIIALLKGTIKRACSFPHLSDFRMERIIRKEHPQVHFHCFENDPEILSKIKASFRKPPYVKLIGTTAEDYIEARSEIYDLIFFDYMSSPKQDLLPLLETHLREDGLFVISEYAARGHDGRHFNPQRGFRMEYHLRYFPMRLRIFRKIKDAICCEIPDVSIKRHPQLPNKVVIRTATHKVLDLKCFLQKEKEAQKKAEESARIAATLAQEAEQATKERQEAEKILAEQQEKRAKEKEEREKALLEEEKEQQETLKERWKRICKHIDMIPQTDKDLLVDYYKNGLSQPELAKKSGKTQGSISQRLTRALERIEFLEKLPTLTYKDQDLLRGYFPDSHYQDVFMFMCKTTCQTRTAQLMAEKWDQRYTQVMVRHRWHKMIEKIEAIQKLSEEKKHSLSNLHNYMVMIDSGNYMLHEVKLPHFEQLAAQRRITCQDPAEIPMA